MPIIESRKAGDHTPIILVVDDDVTLPALLVTGHPAPDLPRRAAGFGIPLLEKPLLGNGLLEAIHEALETSSMHP